jgi:hypothetical protein
MRKLYGFELELLSLNQFFLLESFVLIKLGNF